MPPPPLQDGRPTLTTSQRRQYFEEVRFIEVRHLAYLFYKKPDGEPLLKYEDTLDNRDMVKNNVLAYEVAQGWLIPDGTEGQTQVPAQPQQQPTQPVVQQGAPQMQPFNPPPNGVPAPQPQMAPAPMPQQPQYAMPPQQQMQPQQMQAPVPQQQPIPQPQYAAPAPQMAPPPVATPQQAAGVPPQQEAPAGAPTGRRRKGQGTAVAPPPAAPPPPPQGAPVQQFAPPQQQAMQFGAPPPGMPVPQQMAPPQQMQQMPPAPFGAPVPMQSGPAAYQPQPQAQQGAPQPQQAAAVDLNPVLARVDALARLVAAQNGQIKELRLTAEISLGLLHHLYLVNPQLQPQQGQPQLPRTLPDFKKYFQQFVGTPQ